MSSSRSSTPDPQNISPPSTEAARRLVDAIRRHHLIEADYSGLEMAVMRQVVRDLGMYEAHP